MSIDYELQVISDSMAYDTALAWGWHCNIAMAYQDEGGTHVAANRAAARFMKLAFGLDTSKLPQYRELAKMNPGFDYGVQDA